MTDSHEDAFMHALPGGPVFAGSERGGPRVAGARVARARRNEDRTPQVLIRHYVSLHAGEVVDATRAGWPFVAGPTGGEVLHLLARPFAVPLRAAGFTVVFLLITAVVLFAHAV